MTVHCTDDQYQYQYSVQPGDYEEKVISYKIHENNLNNFMFKCEIISLFQCPKLKT
jgi:hypothetical protein